MAIYHCSVKPIGRSAGRSAVAAIAYRTASRILNERECITHDFTAKQGVVHAEIILPDGVDAPWALDRSSLWNAAEFAERRCDARVAREFEIALPHELTDTERLSLTRAFAADLANRFGAAVDFAIHVPQGKSDDRNVHAHVVMTTRVITPSGLAQKTLIERENRWLIDNGLPTSQMQMKAVREAFADLVNRHLLRAGLDRRVDHRSHLSRGLAIEPTAHMGVHASQMKKRGVDVSRCRIEDDAARRNAELIRRRPEQVLALITSDQSVFTRHDIARTLSRYITDAAAFHNALAAVMASPQLVLLQQEQRHEPARYSTREMIELEQLMAHSAARMAARSGHAVRATTATNAIVRQNEDLTGRGLSDEQKRAVLHVTGPEQISAVIGFAGAGKSTMLTAARRAWEADGYRVHGAALAGKAAEGLSASSGIASRTLASWELGWENERSMLGPKDIFVIDEAGMIGSRQLCRFVREIEARGAKLVLVGDHEQLQAIGAGSPFRAITERIGAIELTEIRRQTEDWQRQASIAFATHRTHDALADYARQNAIRFANDRAQACADLVRDYLADRLQNPDQSRIALAHRRVDVRAINDAIREGLQAEGVLAKGSSRSVTANAEYGVRDRAEQTDGEIVYRTVNGSRAFASGDRIVLLRNDRWLGVKNGMLGTVDAVEPDALHLRLDGLSGGPQTGRRLTIHPKDYQSFDHGYATTIHKAQGATVDRSFVMASASMDRHLTYVAMTRHRHQAMLYAGRDEFKNIKDLTASLGRSGLKETTLDYTDTFAERRGLKEQKEDGIRQQQRVRQTALRQTAERRGPRQGVDIDRVADRDLHLQHQTPQVAAPLVPAITRYDKSVDEIALEKARPELERGMEVVRNVAIRVYHDAFSASEAIKQYLLDPATDPAILARAIRERPDRFGALRGKSGILGDNRERKEALHYARSVASLVENTARTWERQLERERNSETWKREKCDVVEVPALTPRSQEILTHLDALPYSEKPGYVKQMMNSAEGRKALEEAQDIDNALQTRFGTANLRNEHLDRLRITADAHVSVERIKQVTGLVERTHRAALVEKQTLTLGQTQRLGLRI
ncbi:MULTISPECIES: Ti-type conjugative transfer relaxase TraA [Agrobacterium]|uniref:Ti-type conjugative transfer relaxase TraA n=1 Tax=Agrobacterium tumefaciens TaxID=358 RepID=A0AAE6BG66_AGRTU|nr:MULTISPECIES: Ti-type conjugative transfer relaxase TraA [Agrobacterium]QCL76703.1 Ti-type conjugative transfer relaxase TraA [Agrobacterium tumefaciens]QCL82223.1 Ti-type conjugative transfer relaxase TraA [Agrobacterium tumefaciens]CUX64855.1 Ti-type conjugative transfer relaxase TraA [Agrobacterium sp. NCPPB 925]